MTQIGIVRNLDALGRIVPPRAFLKELHINPGDPVEVTAEPGQIVIRPHRPSCIFCGSELGVKAIHDVNVCRQCAMEMPGVFGGVDT